MKIAKLPILILMLMICSVITGGVFASWIYSNDYATSGQGGMGTGIIEFQYKPEEILPGDQESTELHVNHFNLINSIVNHVDYGLNAKKKPIIKNMLLDGAGVVYGDQSVQGGNLKHMLLNTSDVNSLMFVVEYVTDTEFNAYTFVEADASSSNNGKYIQVYKTVIQYGAKWEAKLSYDGVAKVFDPPETSYSIDPKTWVHEHLYNLTENV